MCRAVTLIPLSSGVWGCNINLSVIRSEGPGSVWAVDEMKHTLEKYKVCSAEGASNCGGLLLGRKWFRVLSVACLVAEQEELTPLSSEMAASIL